MRSIGSSAECSASPPICVSRTVACAAIGDLVATTTGCSTTRRKLPQGDEEAPDINAARLCAVRPPARIANGLAILVSAPGADVSAQATAAAVPGPTADNSTRSWLLALTVAAQPDLRRGRGGAHRCSVTELRRPVRHFAVRHRSVRFPGSRCRDDVARPAYIALHYASKAFLCTEIARWVNCRGLSLTCGHRRRSWPWPCTPTSRPTTESLHGNKSVDEPATHGAWCGLYVTSCWTRDRDRTPDAIASAASFRTRGAGDPAWRRTPTSSSLPPTRTRSSGCRWPAARH